jgi:membrane protein YdbS with pleckstrin-like domain
MSNTEQQSLEERSKALRDEYNLYHFELAEGEHILAVTSDHFIEWLPKVAGRVIVGLVCFLVAFLRASGYSFFVMGPPPENTFDTLNTFLSFLLIITVVAWLFLPSKVSSLGRPSGMFSRIFLPFVSLLLVGMIFFHAQGGLIITDIDRSSSVFFDAPNIMLVLVTVVMLAFALWVYIESENDHLLLTTHRVVLSDRTVYGKYSITYIGLEDVQDVQVEINNTLEYVLKTGTVTVQSVRKQLRVPKAEEAESFRKKVMDEVKAIRNRSNEQDYQQLIDTKVYNKPSTGIPSKKQEPVLPRSANRGLLKMIFRLPDNPTRNEKNEITWYPHWIFLLIRLASPFLALVICIGIIAVVVQTTLLTGPLLFLAIASAIIFPVGWGLYNYYDYIDDMYILTPDNIVDVEQTLGGFLSSNKRSANLGAVQNVDLKTGLLGRMIGYGDVFIETAGKGEFTFHGVPQPNEVVRLINTYQDNYKLGDKERTLKETLALIKHYHTALEISNQQQQDGAPHTSPATPRPSEQS